MSFPNVCNARYAKDLIYVASFVLAASTLTNWVYLVWLVVACYVGVKVWQLFIGPW